MKPFLSNAEMIERRPKGLCYYCDEKYTPDHYMKHKVQLFMMEGNEGEDYIVEEAEEVEETEDQCAIAHISLNAVSGFTDHITMRVRGLHGKKNVYVLIDSGSMHNFIDKRIANMMGCKYEPAGRTKVSVADGSRIEVCGIIRNFRWSFQRHQFTTDIMFIPLGRNDVVWVFKCWQPWILSRGIR